MIHTVAEPWMWGAFIAFVIAMLLVDILALGGGKSHKVSVKEAASWSAVWVSLALLFAYGLYKFLLDSHGEEIATTKSMEFLTGYVIEKSLSVDNVFVFLLIFSHFAVPMEHQRKVLLYGVLGAIIMRVAMILAGTWVVTQFSWVLYIIWHIPIIYRDAHVGCGRKRARLSSQPSIKVC